MDLQKVARLVNKIEAMREELKIQYHEERPSVGIIDVCIDFQTRDHPTCHMRGLIHEFGASDITITEWDAECADDEAKYRATAFIDGVEFFELLSEDGAQLFL